MDIKKTADDSHRVRIRRWLGLSVLMLPVLLVTIDNTVLSFALPKISEALQPSATQQLWIIDAYSLVLAGLLVAMGTLGDRIGHRKLLLGGSLGFAFISVLTAFAETTEQVIGGRALMGVFGAMLMPSTLALIRALFEDREQRRLAVAIWATTLTLGSAIGPLVGGILLQFFDWNVIFLLAVPLLVPMLVFGWVLLPGSTQEATVGPIDVLSIAMSLIAMTAIVYGIKHFSSYGSDWVSPSAMALGGIAGWLFIRRQRQLPTPFMDVYLFKNGMFAGSVAINLISLAFLVGFVFFTTQSLQILLGMSPLRASLALIPGQVMAIVVGVTVVPIAQRLSPRVLVPILLAFTATAFLLVAVLGPSLAILIIAFALLNVGVGAITTVSNDLILSAAPPAKSGAASAISETAYEVGVVAGTTVLGGFVTARYRNGLEIPDFLTAAQGDAARDTLAGAFNVVGVLPAEQAELFLRDAALAFEGGIVGVSWVTAGLAALAMLMAWRTLNAPR